MSRRAIRRRLGPGARRPHFGMKRAARGSLVPIGYGKVACGRSASIFGTSGSDQGFARGDAGAAEIARDFLVDVHGMKKRSRAMQECYKGQCHGSMLIWLPAKLIA